jgi:LPS-assembly protein
LFRLRQITIALVALCAVPSAALAQSLGDCRSNRSWTTEQVTKGHIRLKGQVEIDCGDQTFAADEVELFEETNRLIATGDVVFTSGKNRVAADRLEYNTQTKTGTFYNATGTAILKDTKDPLQPRQERDMFGTAEPDIYFYGETLEKVGEQKYKITDGGFTTCVQPTPRWQLTSGTVLLNLDHYALLTNSLFRVKGVPVLYLPVFYYPINDEDRATGFLIPTYGTSTVRGQTISNAFFWAINRSQDATFLHDWYSQTGQGVGAEYRYLAAPGSEGQLRFYNLREHEATYTENGSTVTTPERRSYEIRGSLSQRLSRTFRARARADYFSDITVQQTYNQNVFDSSRRTRVYSGAVSGTLGTWNLTGAFDRNEFFYGTTQSTVRGGTPKVTVSRSDKPLFGSPAYFSLSSELANFTALRKTSTSTVDNGLSRVDVMPRVRLPFTKWQFLTVSTTAAFRYTYWTEQKDTRPGQSGENLEEAIDRRYFEFASQVTGPVFNRIWSRPGSGYAEKIKHAIEPFFNLQRVSAIEEFDQLVRIDGIDTIVGRVTRLSYGVNNRLFRKPGGGGRSTEILTVALGQSYYSDDRASQYDRYYQSAYGTSAPSKFSPLSLQVRSWPTAGVNAQFRAEYDTKFNAIRTMSADGTIAARDWLHTTFGWSQRRFIEGLSGFDDPERLDHYLNSGTSWKALRNRIGGSYTFNYDIKTGRFLQQRLLNYYNAQCCGFALEYQQFDLSGFSTNLPVQKDQRFNFSVTLAGIGSFSNFFGAFGGGGSGGRY